MRCASVLAVILVSACSGTTSCEAKLTSKKERVEEAIREHLGSKGLELAYVECPDVALAKGTEMTCTGYIKKLEVKIAVTFTSGEDFNIEPDLPGLFVADGKKIEELVRTRIGEAIQSVECDARMLFWEARRKLGCRMTVEGQPVRLVVTHTGGEEVELDHEEEIRDMDRYRAGIVEQLREDLGPEVALDCGEPRYRLTMKGRRSECALTWKGGSGTMLLNLQPGEPGAMVVAASGLTPRQRTVLVARGQGEDGDVWNCGTGTSIVRGERIDCTRERGGVKTSMQATPDEPTVQWVLAEVRSP